MSEESKVILFQVYECLAYCKVHMIFLASPGSSNWNGLRSFPHSQEKRLGSQRHDIPSVEGVSQSFICDACMDVSTYAEQILTSPDTLGYVIDYVSGSVCRAVSGLQQEVFLYL